MVQKKTKKHMRFASKLNFHNLQKKKVYIVYAPFYNILTIGIDMFQFQVKIIKDSVFFHLVPPSI